jgi:site-specific recombinase XerD
MTQEEILERVRFHAELRGLSHHTVIEYITKAKLYQQHYGKPADELGLTDIQNFLHYLQHERQVAPGSLNTYNSGLRFLYNVVLDKPLNLHKIPCQRKLRSFPDILTRQEVEQLFAGCENLRDKCILMTAYSAGLRVREVASLRVGDIDSANMQLFIRYAKGGKDRYAILSQRNLNILREYWKAYRPTGYLFHSLRLKPNPEKHLTVKSLQDIFHKARINAGLTKDVSFHTLRHSFATHLLEDGVSIYHIKQLLGHSDISTTCFYIHLVKISQLKVRSPLDTFKSGEADG